MVQPERELPPLKVGETISWPDVNPATIVYVFDTRAGFNRDHPAYGRGFMGVRENGNMDVFWHRWIRGPGGSFRSVLAHHGGKDGFDDIETPIRQCRRIITGYMGIEEKIEPGDDLTEADQRPPVNLAEIGNLIDQSTEVVHIPGYQDWALSIKAQIDRATRQVITRPGYLSSGGSINILQALRRQLDRSRNPFLSATGDDIEEALLSDDRFKQFEALQRGGQRMIDRMAQIDTMVISVMQRHNRLEAHRSNTESNIRRLYSAVMSAQGRWDGLEYTERPVVVSRLTADSTLYLNALVSNPYQKRGQRVAQLKNLDNILVVRGHERVGTVIKRTAVELSHWKDDIDEAQRGRFTDRYPVES